MTQYSKRKVATLPCIVCGLKLEQTGPGGDNNHPMDGLIFRSPGQYGSTKFDPVDGSTLEINICDPCIIKAAKKKTVLFNASPMERKIKTAYWDGKG